MALTRKMLKAMGIEDEKIEQIIDAHTETVGALKDERDKYREDAEKLAETQKKLDAMLKENSGRENFEEKYNALNAEFEKYKNEIATKETKGAKEKAFRAMLKKIGVSEKRIDTVVKVTNLDDLKLDKDGNIADAEKVEAQTKTEWADFIVTSGEVKASPETPPTSIASNTQPKEHRAAKIAAEYHRKLYGGSNNAPNFGGNTTQTQAQANNKQ